MGRRIWVSAIGHGETIISPLTALMPIVSRSIARANAQRTFFKS